MKGKIKYANLDQYELIEKLKENDPETSNPILQKYMTRFMKPLTKDEVIKAFLTAGYTSKKETTHGETTKLEFDGFIIVNIADKHYTFNITISRVTFIGTLIGDQLFLVRDNSTRDSVFFAHIPWKYDANKLKKLFGDKNYGDYDFISAEDLVYEKKIMFS